MARVNTAGPSKSGIQNSSYTYAADAEASDAYAITVSPTPSAYATGQKFIFKANTANTGAASLNVNSLGAITLKKNHDQDLATGDIEVGSIVEVVYDSTGPVFQVTSVTAVAPGDVVGQSSSVDSEIALFSGTGGKTIKRATTTGLLKAASGVIAAAIAGTDYIAPGAGNADSSVTDASTTAKGKIEIAIGSEVDTGTDATRAVSPDALAESYAGTKSVQLTAFDYATNTAVGNGAAYFRIPTALGGMNLVAVAARVITAGTTNTTDIQIHNLTQAADMLTTKLTIDSGETDSSTAAAAVIDTANDDVATGDLIRIDVDAVSTTPAQGLLVILEFRLP